MADSSITFSTALDNGQLEKDLKRAEKDIDTLKRKVERADSSANAIADKMEEADRAIDATKAQIRALNAELQGLDATDPNDASAWFAAQSQIAGVRERIAETTDELKRQEKGQDALQKRWEQLDASAAEYRGQLEAATNRAGDLSLELTKAGTKGGAALSAGIAGAEARVAAFSARLATMVRRVFVFGAILGVLRALRDTMGEALVENERFAGSLEGLKATVRGFASGVAAMIAPALTAAVNMCTAALLTLARIIDGIFGTSIAQAIIAARQAAEQSWVLGDSADKAAKSLGKQAKATKKLAKEQEKANKSLLAFDELNQLSEDTDTDTGDTAGGGGGGGTGGGAAWDALDVGKIGEKLAEVMLILGGALMAVGAILAFSGINIPLGLTLMAIGALMIYTAYQEQWDKLPAQVRNAITTAFVLTGVVMMVIGAVLAFSGVNVALGIGMMAAGAALVVTAAALNWTALPTRCQKTIAGALKLVGAVALVIGAALAFSGVNIPLGIGIMLAGATALAASAALNWDSLSTQLSTTIGSTLKLVGTVALAIGAVLAFTGVNMPLGIGLMALGAGALVGGAALNWDSLTSDLNATLSSTITLVGAAALAIGAVLAFTGVNMPLGIALMAIGVGAMIATADIDWDFILNSLKTVWNNIKIWFQTNVQPYLTWSYWQNVFKGIVNGLISCLNAALGDVGWFVNSLSSGIGSLLNYLGVTGWGFSISMPQIPYLAQGAVIPPNREFLAVLGDQRSGNNIETPEDLMRQVVREEAGAVLAQLMAMMPGIGAGAAGDQRDVVLMVGREELARVTVQGIRDLRSTGEFGGLVLDFD